MWAWGLLCPRKSTPIVLGIQRRIDHRNGKAPRRRQRFIRPSGRFGSTAARQLASTFQCSTFERTDSPNVGPRSNSASTGSRPTWAPTRQGGDMKSVNAAQSMMLAFAVALFPAAAHSEETHHEWDYGAEHGPKHWGDLKAEFESCGLGKTQSPI